MIKPVDKDNAIQRLGWGFARRAVLSRDGLKTAKRRGYQIRALTPFGSVETRLKSVCRRIRENGPLVVKIFQHENGQPDFVLAEEIHEPV